MEVMNTSEIVGDVVQIFLTDLEGLGALGFADSVLFLKVAGVDELGLWVEHPSYVIVKANDEQGRPLPEDQRQHRRLEANFIIRWEQIGTIVHFPNRDGFDFPNPYEKHIGFVIPEEEPVEESTE